MKYETKHKIKSGTYASGASETFTFTYGNNISNIRNIYLTSDNYTANGGYMFIDAITISGNVLTVTVTNGYNGSGTPNMFLIATVATY